MSDKDRRINQIKASICKLLKEHGKMHTKKIAGYLPMTPATTSKYLQILEGEKKVKKHDDQLPYVYWTLIEKKDAQENNKRPKSQ